MAGRALITGISGFTGRYVAAELLRSGYEVHGVGRDKKGPEGVATHNADLLDYARLSSLVAELSPSVVVHLAAIAFVGHDDVSDMYLSNVVGTRNLLKALVDSKSDPASVLLASSANIYGNSDAGILDETVPCNPVNDYAVSKCAMEMMARQWFHALPIIIVRPFNYTGVGQSLDFLVPKIVDHFAAGKATIELGNTDVFRDFSDVRAVAESYARLLQHGVPGETYNVCSGREYDVNFILETLTKLSGHSLEVKTNPRFVRANEVKRLKGSNSKLLSATGSAPGIPLEETLSWMLRQATDGPGL